MTPRGKPEEPRWNSVLINKAHQKHRQGAKMMTFIEQSTLSAPISSDRRRVAAEYVRMISATAAALTQHVPRAALPFNEAWPCRVSARFAESGRRTEVKFRTRSAAQTKTPPPFEPRYIFGAGTLI